MIWSLYSLDLDYIPYTLLIYGFLVVGISEVLQELWNVITKHVIYSLYHFRLQLFKLVDAVTGQNLSEVLNIWEITWRQVELPLNLKKQE